MPAEHFVIFYDALNGHVTRWVVCDGQNETDKNLDSHRPGGGEIMLRVPMAEYGNLDKIQALANTDSGKAPVRKTFAVLDDADEVTNVLHAYVPPSGPKVFDATGQDIAKGDKIVAGQLEKKPIDPGAISVLSVNVEAP